MDGSVVSAAYHLHRPAHPSPRWFAPYGRCAPSPSTSPGTPSRPPLESKAMPASFSIGYHQSPPQERGTKPVQLRSGFGMHVPPDAVHPLPIDQPCQRTLMLVSSNGPKAVSTNRSKRGGVDFIVVRGTTRTARTKNFILNTHELARAGLGCAMVTRNTRSAGRSSRRCCRRPSRWVRAQGGT